jgi:hypothetical protein
LENPVLNKELQTKPGLGWNGGIIDTNWDMVYGIQFKKTILLSQRATFLVNEDVNLNYVGPNFIVLSYRLIKHILSIEFGPISGKSEYDKDKKTTLFQEPRWIFRIF